MYHKRTTVKPHRYFLTAIVGLSHRRGRSLIARLTGIMSLILVPSVQAQLNYSENFDVPGVNWSVTGGVHQGQTLQNSCNGAGALRSNLYIFENSTTFTSGNLGTSNGLLATLTYKFKVIDFTGGAATTPSSVNLKMQYASSFSGPWTDLPPINHVQSASCATVTAQFISPAGNCYLRLVGYRNGGDFYIYFDEVSLTQLPSVAPPCSAGFLPLTGSTGFVTTPTLSWGAVSAASEYDVYFGTSATPPLVGSVPTTSYIPVSPLAANTQYFWKIAPKNPYGAASGCTTQSFTTANNLVYCTPTYENGPGTADAITNVTLASLNNTSTGAAAPYYTLNNAVTIPNIGAGNKAVVSVKMDSNANQFAAVWIDFNKNGIFETTEGVASAVNAGANGTVVLTLDVPIGTTTGTTRMRVRGGDDAAITTAQACGATNSTVGETEDYIVNVIPNVSCATLISPANGATNVTNFTLSWAAPTTGTLANSYDVYLGTTSNPVFYANVTTTSLVVVSTFSNTTYYWKVIPKSVLGVEGSGCAVNTLTTGNPFLPYCSNIIYGDGIWPTTLVRFAGIDRRSPTSSQHHIENFISDVANVSQGASYTLTLQAKPTMYYPTNFVAFFDWNHDGDFNDAGETYLAGSVYMTNGEDNIFAVTSIAVPATALPGPTRMRIKNLFNFQTAPITDPCTGSTPYYYGQTEDYTVNICVPTIWYADSDNDGYGNPAVTLSACNQPAGYVANNTDCTDTNASLHQTLTFYADADADGFGNSSVTVLACTPPVGYVSNSTDCNDNQTRYLDGDGDGFGSMVKVACGGVLNSSDCNDYVIFYTDNDGDYFGTLPMIPCGPGSTDNLDCNDNLILYEDFDGDGYGSHQVVYCHGVPNNTDCNDFNNTVFQSNTLFIDADGDGYNAGSAIVCYGANIPSGYAIATNGTDCNDANNTVWRTANLYVDADHDGFTSGVMQTVCYGATIPPGFVVSLTTIDCNDNQIQFLDDDGDGFGSMVKVACGGVLNSSDCNDYVIFYTDNDGDYFGTLPMIPCGPGSTDNLDCNDNLILYEDFDGDGYGSHQVVYCHGVPNNTDCDDFNNAVFQSSTLFIDADGDGYDAGTSIICYATNAPSGYAAATNGTDCNDTNITAWHTGTLYVDADHDGYTSGVTQSVCYGATAPLGFVTSLTTIDCNDSDATVYRTAALYVDADGDGFTSGLTASVCYGATVPMGYVVSLTNIDCNDNNANIHQSFLFYPDADGDSFGTGNAVSVCATNAATPPIGYALNNTDCNDGDHSIFQTATLYADADNDGYTSGVSLTVCYGASIPSGFVASLTAIDCNDTIAAIHPNAAEIPYNGADDDCDGVIDETGTVTTTLLPSSCQTTLAAVGSLIGITTLAGQPITGYRIRITNGAQVQIIEKNVPHFTLPEFAAYAYATTYTVNIQLQRNGIWQASWGASCQVSTPAVLASGGATQVSPSQCGITLPTINTLIATTSLAGVTGYRFKVTNITAGASGPNVVQTIDRSIHWFSLPMLAQYNYGTTYRIEIAVKTNGAYSGFGAPCEISSPPSPSLTNCGGITASPSTLIATSSLQGVAQYRFQITRMLDNATATIDRNSNYFTFSMVPGYTHAAQYAVRVAVMTAGSWSPFGDACEITSPGSAARFIAEKPTEIPESEFKAAAYPNPFASVFAIDVKSSSTAAVELKVYDMLGKRIESREVRLEDLSGEKIGASYPTGIYNVILSQDGIVRTLRIIKR